MRRFACASAANPLLPWWVPTLLRLLGVLLPISCFHVDIGIVVGTSKSQGLFWTEVSVSMIGWPAVIDGAAPTERPPKSIVTDGKDEMALETLAVTTTI